MNVYHLKDYLEYGTRKQFWKEPAVARIMEAIKDKEMDMKGAAALIGVSYGTLYGHYREAFGYLNSSMVSSCTLSSYFYKQVMMR